MGLSGEALAAAGGVSRRSQSFYEAGERCPDAKYLERIAAIGVDVFYLLTGTRFDLVGQLLEGIEQKLEAGGADPLLLREQLDGLRESASRTQLARIDLLLSLLGDSASQKARDLTLADLARKSQLARERAAKLASGGLLLEVLATAYFHGINDEGAAQLAAMLAAPLAANS